MIAIYLTLSEQAAQWAFQNNRKYDEAAARFEVHKGQIARAWRKLGYPSRKPRADGQQRDAAFLLILAEHLAARVLHEMVPPAARSALIERLAANIAELLATRSGH